MTMTLVQQRGLDAVAPSKCRSMNTASDSKQYIPQASRSQLNGSPSFQRRKATAQAGGVPKLRVIAQAWRQRDTKNVEGRSKALLHSLSKTDGSRDEVVAALDAWAAFQQDFPLLATKRVMHELRAREEWVRLIQVSKWLLQKGHGRTFGTYADLLEAMAKLQRDEEMDQLWDIVLQENLEAVPRTVFGQAMKLYSARQRPLKVLELYGSMEGLGMRLDEATLRLVSASLEAVGAPKLADKLSKEYTSQRTEWRYSDGVRKQVKSFGKPIAGQEVLPYSAAVHTTPQ